MTFIALTKLEALTACVVGVTRRLSSITRGRANHKQSDAGDFQIDVEGAIAEACFAKHQGQYWGCGLDTFKGPDVGPWQVRSSRYVEGHCIVRPSDRPGDRIAFLVVPADRLGAYLVGWIKTETAKTDRYWRPDKWSWWVPQDELSAFDVAPRDRVVGARTAAGT